MKISYKWLKDYVNIDLSADEVSKILTDTGLEVEGLEEVQSIKGGLEGLVIGEVLSKEKHPDADKLSVTTVDLGGDKPVQIVCGAPNVDAGQKVVVATVGTVLYDGDNEFKIKKSKIRGFESLGMICAEDEIGLGKSHDGIMVLDADAKVGTPAKEFFNIESDFVFEIGLTPNRIDGASHIGTARDIVAYLKQTQESKLEIPSVEKFAIDNTSVNVDVEVLHAEGCQRYSGVCISNIEIKESPDWLKNRLQILGLSPINNVVDITNYVLHETGQPLHAFDYSKIKGAKIVVNTVADKTKFVTLDEVERELTDRDLMINNAEEGMCIAGVMGGLDSGVSNSTTSIFLESAYFNPVMVRKTARRNGLNTDSSFRFERGCDANNTIYALKRAALLIKELAGGEISSEIFDHYPTKIENYRVEVSYSRMNRLIGKELSKETVNNILKSLDIEVLEDNGDEAVLSVATYRVDVLREADVVEEILRIYGYNNIEFSARVNASLAPAQKPDREKLRNVVANSLSDNGFNEIMCNSLTKYALYEDTKPFIAEETVKILNPLSSDLNAFRQSLIFGGLESIAYNINRRSPNLKFYEFGNCYKYNSCDSNDVTDKYVYTENLGLFMVGSKSEESWATPQQGVNFYTLKSFVDNVLARFGLKPQNMDVTTVSNDVISEGLAYRFKTGKDSFANLVEFGYVNRKALKAFGIDNQVFFAEFNWDLLMDKLNTKVIFEELSKFPIVKRDLSMLLDKKVKFEDIQKLATKAERNLLTSVNLFDLYEGDKLEEGKKSYAVSFYLQDKNKTLTDKQIDKIMKKLISTFERELNAQLR